MVTTSVLNSPTLAVVPASANPIRDPFTPRSLLDLLQAGTKFEWIKSDCSSEEWQQLRRRYNEDYVDGCLSVAKSIQKLENHPQLQSRLHQLRFEFFPVQAGAKLLKLEPDVIEKCVSELEEIQSTVKSLSERILKQVINNQRPTTTQKLRLEDAIPDEHWEKITLKLGLDGEKLRLLQQQLSDDEVTASELINFCHKNQLVELPQIRKLLTLKEYANWIEGQTEIYQHKSLELLAECDRLQNSYLSVLENENSLTEENYRLTQQLQEEQKLRELVQQQLIAKEAETSQQTKESPSTDAPSSKSTIEQQESSPYDINNPASMQNDQDDNAAIIGENQSPYPAVTQYISQASVGILKDGQIINQGKMIGKISDQIRVKCDSGENELFDLGKLVLLPEEHSPSKEEKPKGKVPRKKRGFGS